MIAGHRQGRSGREAGLSLLQAMVFIAAAMMLAAAAMPLAFRVLELAERRELVRRMEALEDGLLAFYRDHRRLPTESEGLEALFTDPGTGDWRGPYVPLADRELVLRDPRGNELTWRRSGRAGVLASPAFPGITRTVDPAPVDLSFRRIAVRELRELKEAALAYRDDYGGLPDSVGDLVPARLGEDYALDPWGHPYAIDPDAGEIRSAGPDGETGTADDQVIALGVTGGVPAGGGGSGGGIPAPPTFVPTPPPLRATTAAEHDALARRYERAARQAQDGTPEGSERSGTLRGMYLYHLYRAIGLRIDIHVNP